MPKTPTIQIRLGQRTPEKLKEWADNQTNLTDSARRVFDHFIDLYGTADIDSLEVKVKMAKDLLAVQGIQSETIKIPETVMSHPTKPVDTPVKKKTITRRTEIDI